jgi:predicted ATP-dependent endonuclease of OLD family
MKTWDELLDKYEDEENIDYFDMLAFLDECTFADYLMAIEEYIISKSNEEYYSLFDDIDDYSIFSDIIYDSKSGEKRKLKFNFNVKIDSKNNVTKVLSTKYDSFIIKIIDTNSKSKLAKRNFNYLFRDNKKRDSIKKIIYDKILDIISRSQSLKFSENGEETEDKFDISLREIIVFFNDDEFFSGSTWTKLSDQKKKKLFIDATLFHLTFTEIIPSVLANFLNIERHFGAVRKTPKYKYVVKRDNQEFNESDNKNYYNLLNYFPAQKTSDFWENKFYLVNDYISSEGINLGKQIYSEINNNNGFLKLKLKKGKSINLADAPSGLLQLFPILASISLRKEHVYSNNENIDRFSIEQPELHLHPKAQTILLQHLKDNNAFSNLIIETHSEHIIRKLQVMYANGEISDEEFNINYFENKNGKTIIKKMEMEENGFFKEPWPNGFFDEKVNLLKQLIIGK